MGSVNAVEVSFIDQIIEFFRQHIVFNVGLLLVGGYTFGKIAEKISLPAITGYIVAGLFMGSSFLNLVTHEMSDILNSITEVALGLIALTIGAEFRIPKLRKVGSNILVVTVFEAIFAFITVTIILTIIGMEFRYSLILGAISAATAPAATVVIIKELRARGPFVDYLYGVVAFDDAVCVILFSIVFAMVSPLLISAGTVAGAAGAAAHHGGLLSGVFHAAKDLVLSTVIGFIGGVTLHLLIRKKYKLNEILIVSVSVIFLVTAIAIVFKISPLIADMVFGAVLVNLANKNKRVFNVLEPVTPPIFALFFILAGMELNVSVLTKGAVVVYGLIYLTARFAGKLVGVLLSGKIIKAPPKVRKYLGLCLFPQAGVAIGLVLFVKTSPVLLQAVPAVRETLDLILNIVLVSVFINELVGPSISRFGIVRGAGLD